MLDFDKEIKKLEKEFKKSIKDLKAKFKEEKALPFDKKSFQDFTWEEIKEIDRLGIADKYFEIKQTRDDYLKLTNEKITTMIINLNPLVLTFKIDGHFEINPTYRDENGERIYWETSKMRNVYMKRIFALLPDDMQKVIAETEIKTDLGTCKDKLWLFSKEEIEKEKFDFFKNNSWEDFEDNRLSWTRSAYSSTTNDFYFIYGNGDIDSYIVSFTNGVRIAFTLKYDTLVDRNGKENE